MNDVPFTDIKTAIEIGDLVSRLCPRDQNYILNLINTIVFCRQIESMRQQQKSNQEGQDNGAADHN